MVGVYGQVIPAVGWTAGTFDSWEDDDPADHEVTAPYEDISVDPDILSDDYLSSSWYVWPDDELAFIGGIALKRILYGNN
jgi:hypothetical protein